MTTQALDETREQLWRAEVAVVEFLRVRLSEVCSLNSAYLNDTGEKWGDAPTYFLVEIHVPVGPTNETSEAAKEVLDEALGDAGYVFPSRTMTPELFIVPDGNDLYVRHSIRIEIQAPYEHDEDSFRR